MLWTAILLSLPFLAQLEAKPQSVFTSSQLEKSTPSIPLGLWKHLKSTERTRSMQEGETDHGQIHFDPSSSPAPTYESQSFRQHISHDRSVPAPAGETTFNQRYWFDATYYVEGGPVFLLDGGETDGEGRLPFLKEGILRILSEATGGMGVILEHRYYGESFPVASLNTDSFVYLTTSQSLSDSAHFARTISYPGLTHLNLTSSSVPYIYIGGSYAGAKSAFARKLFPEVFMGAIASSAVTTAVENFWEYYEPIRAAAPPGCIQFLIAHTARVDQVLDAKQPFLTNALKALFGLEGVTDDGDFVNALTIPLGSWQARNWDSEVGSSVFEGFCTVLEKEGEEERGLDDPPRVPGDPQKDFQSFFNYAQWIKDNVASLCPEGMSQDDCFGTAVAYSASGESIEEGSWKSWPYQFCTEWGYSIGCPPDSEIPSLVSRLLTPEYTSAICSLAFPDGQLNRVPSSPNVTEINQYGSFELSYPRLAFVDGSEDPWLYATPHSPHALNPRRIDVIARPFKLIEGGVHHWDENGRLDGNVPLTIQKIHNEEIEFVRTWLEEWRDERSLQ